MVIKNKKWDEDEFLKERREVLGLWSTAREIDLEEAVEYHKGLRKTQKWVDCLAEAKKQGKILIGAMIGKASVEETLNDAKPIEENGADFFYLLPDTYSRRAMYAKVEEALQASIKQERPLLNGFPIVNHGLKKARRIREGIGVPIRLMDASSEHCMLLTEMGLAAGFAHGAGDVESVLRTSKYYPLEQKIWEGQYQNRLVGYYTERGAPISVLIHNALCGFDPPEIKVALGVLHSLLVAEQGVKYISQEASLSCNLIQDVAALRVAREMTEEFLTGFGYQVTVSLACFPFAGPWPRNRDDAAGVCAWNTVIPILAGTDWFPVKSIEEGHNIPSKEANIAAIRLAKRILGCIGSQRLNESQELTLEKKIIRLGARAIIEKTLELGDGDAALGQVKAVEQGVIDAAFSPYRKVKGAVFYLRDKTGAMRYLRYGNIPLPREVVEYHQERIAERQRLVERKTATEMMVEDIYYVSGDVKV